MNRPVKSWVISPKTYVTNRLERERGIEMPRKVLGQFRHLDVAKRLLPCRRGRALGEFCAERLRRPAEMQHVPGMCKPANLHKREDERCAKCSEDGARTSSTTSLGNGSHVHAGPGTSSTSDPSDSSREVGFLACFLRAIRKEEERTPCLSVELRSASSCEYSYDNVGASSQACRAHESVRFVASSRCPGVITWDLELEVTWT